MLREITQSDQSPTTEVVELRADTVRGTLQRSVSPTAAAVLLRDLEHCRTMLDLRGWAWQCAWAIGNRAEVRKPTT